MLVKSVFVRYFRMAAFLKQMFFLFWFFVSVNAFSSTGCSEDYVRKKEIHLMVRQLGHQLLAQSGDSFSRLKPVMEIDASTFRLQFETDLLFSHDSLVTLAKHIFPKTDFPSGFIVTVHECLTSQIVYGFQVNYKTPDLLPCLGRRAALGCYSIEISFLDLLKDDVASRKQAEIATRSKAVNKSVLQHDQQKSSAIADVSNNKVFPIVTTDTGVVEQGKLVKTRESHPIRIESHLMNIVIGVIFLSIGVALAIGRLKRSSSRVAMKTENEAVPAKSSSSSGDALGHFYLNQKEQSLLFDRELIRLTEKEFKILEMLRVSFGELVLRETLLQKIWFDEGIVTGRSLDMFVSKLRKKLSLDPSLKITNVHGKGYKLERVEG